MPRVFTFGRARFRLLFPYAMRKQFAAGLRRSVDLSLFPCLPGTVWPGPGLDFSSVSVSVSSSVSLVSVFESGS